MIGSMKLLLLAAISMACWAQDMAKVQVFPIDIQNLRNFGLPGLEGAKDHWQIIVKPAKPGTTDVRINFTLVVNGKPQRMVQWSDNGYYGGVFFVFVDRIADTKIEDVKVTELAEKE